MTSNNISSRNKFHELTIAELFNLFKETNEGELLNRIFNKQYKLLVAFAMKKVGDLDTAQALTHDTFLEWKYKILNPTKKEIEFADKYAMGIMKNKILKYYRTKQQKLDDVNSKYFDANIIELELYD